MVTNVLALSLHSREGEMGVGDTANRKDMSNKDITFILLVVTEKSLRSVVLDNTTDLPRLFIQAAFPSFVLAFSLPAFKKS